MTSGLGPLWKLPYCGGGFCGGHVSGFPTATSAVVDQFYLLKARQLDGNTIPDLISTSDTIAVLAIDEVVAAYGCCIHPKSETDQRASFAISLIAMNTHWKLLRIATKKGGDHLFTFWSRQVLETSGDWEKLAPLYGAKFSGQAMMVNGSSWWYDRSAPFCWLFAASMLNKHSPLGSPASPYFGAKKQSLIHWFKMV